MSAVNAAHIYNELCHVHNMRQSLLSTKDFVADIAEKVVGELMNFYGTGPRTARQNRNNINTLLTHT